MIKTIINISLLCSIFLILLIKPIRKAPILMKVVIFLLLFILTSIIPFENIFYTFPSVEAAWDYEYDGKILEVIDGKLSSLVAFETENHYSFAAYPRANNGWKLNTNFSRGKMVSLGSQTVVFICKTQNPNECILIVE